MKRDDVLRELMQLYGKLEEPKEKRARKEQMLEISEKIKQHLQSLVDDLDSI